MNEPQTETGRRLSSYAAAVLKLTKPEMQSKAAQTIREDVLRIESEMREKVLAEWRRRRPGIDTPTYLRITRRITEAEYREQIDRQRESFGLPPMRWDEPVADGRRKKAEAAAAEYIHLSAPSEEEAPS